MGSFTSANKSISIDLNDSMEDANECQHFSLRGYVSIMREKDPKKCWPFPIESEERPSFPPLKVPKIRRWNCESCMKGTITEGPDDTNDQTNFNFCNTESGPNSNLGEAARTSCIQQDPLMPESAVVQRDFDLNIPFELSNDDDCLQITEKTENNAKVTYPDIGLENNLNLNLPASSIPSPKIYPDLGQEAHTKKRGRDECDETYDVELVARTPLNSEHIACRDVVAIGNTINTVEGDIQDHRPTKPFRLGRKKPRRTRLIADILRETAEPSTERMIGQGFVSSPPSMDIIPLQSVSEHTIHAMNSPSLMDASRRSSSTSFDVVVGAQLLQRAFCSHDRFNKLKIGSSISDKIFIKSTKGESSKPALKDKVSKEFRLPSHERELEELASRMDFCGTQGTFGASIRIYESLSDLNRNPADFTVLEKENPYTINGEDLHFEESDEE